MNPRQTFGPKVHTKLCGKRLRYPCTVPAQEQQALNDKRPGLPKSLRDLRAKRIGEADEALSVPPSAQFASMCERIGAQLEVHHQWPGQRLSRRARTGRVNTFDVRWRSVAGGRPQALALPAGIRIVDAAV